MAIALSVTWLAGLYAAYWVGFLRGKKHAAVAARRAYQGGHTEDLIDWWERDGTL